MGLDENWRPADWTLIKRNILEEVPMVFSPSVGYTKEQKDTIMEKTATILLRRLSDAGLIHSSE